MDCSKQFLKIAERVLQLIIFRNLLSVQYLTFIPPVFHETAAAWPNG